MHTQQVTAAIPSEAETKLRSRAELEAQNARRFSNYTHHEIKDVSEEQILAAYQSTNAMYEFCREQGFSPNRNPTAVEVRNALRIQGVSCNLTALGNKLASIANEYTTEENASADNATTYSIMPYALAASWNHLQTSLGIPPTTQELYKFMLDLFPLKLPNKIESFAETIRRLREEPNAELPNEIKEFFKDKHVRDLRPSGLFDEYLLADYNAVAAKLSRKPNLSELADFIRKQRPKVEISEDRIKRLCRSNNLELLEHPLDLERRAQRAVIKLYFAQSRAAIGRAPTIAEMEAAFQKALPNRLDQKNWDYKSTSDAVQAFKRWIERYGKAKDKDLDLIFYSQKKVVADKNFQAAPEISSKNLKIINALLDPKGDFKPVSKTVTKKAPVKAKQVPQPTKKIPKNDNDKRALAATPKQPAEEKLEPLEPSRPKTEKVFERKPPIATNIPAIRSLIQPKISQPTEVKEALPENLQAIFSALNELILYFRAGEAEGAKPQLFKNDATFDSQTFSEYLKAAGIDLDLESCTKIFPALKNPLGDLFSFMNSRTVPLKSIEATQLVRVVNLVKLALLDFADNPNSFEQLDPTFVAKILQQKAVQNRNANLAFNRPITQALEEELLSVEAVDERIRRIPDLGLQYLCLQTKRLTFLNYGPAEENLFIFAFSSIIQRYRADSTKAAEPRSEFKAKLTKFDLAIKFTTERSELWSQISSIIEKELNRWEN